MNGAILSSFSRLRNVGMVGNCGTHGKQRGRRVKFKEKLVLDGNFEISQARFLQSEIQEKIDNFSRRGQGKPKNPEIVDIPSLST